MKYIIVFILMFVPLFCDAKLTDDNFKDIKVSTRKAKGNLLDFTGMYTKGIAGLFDSPILFASNYDTDDYKIFVDGYTVYKYDKKDQSIRYAKLFEENEISDNETISFSLKVGNYFLVANGKNFVTFDEDLHIIAKKVIDVKNLDPISLMTFQNKYFVIDGDETISIYDKELKLVKDIQYPQTTSRVITGNDCIYFFNAGADEYVKLVIFDKNFKDKELSLDVPGGYSLRNLAPFKKDGFAALFIGADDGILRIYDKDGKVLKEEKTKLYTGINYLEGMTLLFAGDTSNDSQIYVLKDDYSTELLDMGYDEKAMAKVAEKIERTIMNENANYEPFTYDISKDCVSFLLYDTEHVYGDNNVKLRTFDTKGNLIFSRDITVMYTGKNIDTGLENMKKTFYALRKFGDYYFSFLKYENTFEFIVYDKDFKEVYKNAGDNYVDLSRSIISNIIPLKGGCFFIFTFNKIADDDFDSIKDLNSVDFKFEDEIVNLGSGFDLNYKYVAVNMKFTYNVNSSDGIKSNIDKAKCGDKVTFEVEDRNGYVLSSVSVVDSDGNAIKVDGNSFVMPDSNVTIKANYKKFENPNTKGGGIVFISLLAISGFMFIYLYSNKKRLE